MRGPFLLVGATLILLSSSWFDCASADNACSYPQAAGSSPYDLSEIIANSHLLPDMQIFNIYWSDNWDATQPFTEDESDNATKALIDSGYFDKGCQYGVPKMHFGGSRSTKGYTPCSSNPMQTETSIGLMQFLACEEASNQVATAKGVPSPACLGCDLSTGFRCYTDGACLSQPNPSGDTIYNIFCRRESLYQTRTSARTEAFTSRFHQTSICMLRLGPMGFRCTWL